MQINIQVIENCLIVIYRYTKRDIHSGLFFWIKGIPSPYKARKDQPHSPKGEYHIHVYAKGTEILAINEGGKGHDGFQNVEIPRKVYKVLIAKYPNWKWPANRIVPFINISQLSSTDIILLYRSKGRPRKLEL